MPRSFNTIFFSVGQNTYRLHFPYILGEVGAQMLSGNDGDRFTSDAREYSINGFAHGSATYDIRVRESGADILPGRIDAWFTREGKGAAIPLDLQENIRMRNEEATQNRIAIYVNGKQV